MRYSKILPSSLKIAAQALYWAAYFLLLAILLEEQGNDPKWPDVFNTGDFMGWAVINLPFKVLLFNLYFYFLYPKWLYKKPLYLLGATVLLFALYPPLKIWIDSLVGIKGYNIISFTIAKGSELKEGEIFNAISWSQRTFTVLGNMVTAFVARMIVDGIKNLKLKSQMEKLALQSELDMLRHQINPHFLFNTLNNIDGMIFETSPEGSEAIGKLAGIMRYMLYESNAEFVPLEKETEYIRNFFDLQKLRLREKDQAVFEVSGSLDGLKIAPLLLISFVENAFKHGTRGADGLRVNCKLAAENGGIAFVCENSYEKGITEGKDAVGGVGMVNVKRRLQLLYTGKHQIETTESNNVYTVRLNLSGL